MTTSPIWLSPSAPGQMTNKRGSNTGADSIALSARSVSYSPGSLRVITSRVGTGGISTTPQTYHDTGWCGTPTLSAIPALPEGNPTFYPNSSATCNGRVYLVDGLGGFVGGVPTGIYQGSIISAPITGASVGAWRFETNPASVITVGDRPAACRTTMTIFKGTGGQSSYIYIFYTGGSGAGASSVYWAPILADGTFGAWTASANPGTVYGAEQAIIVAGEVNWLLILGGTSYYATINLFTGVIGAWTVAAAIGGNSIAQGGAIYDVSHNKIFVIGGGNPVATTVYYATVNISTGALSGGGTNATGLPAARSMFAMAFARDSTGDTAGTVYVIGGGSALAGGTPQTSVYSATTAVLDAGTAWTTGTVLTSSHSITAGWSTTNLDPATGITMDKQSADLTLANLKPYVFTTGTPGATTPILAARADRPGNSAWVTGAAPPLPTAGGLTTIANANGGLDLSWVYAGFGTPAIGGGFNDNDQVQVSVQFVDAAGTGVSPAALSLFRVGQPPTLTSLLPGAAIGTGKPTASFAYNPGAGGGPEATWQITVKIGATVYFDSGLRRDQNNSVVINLAPLLLTATAYTFSWTAASTDPVFNGASNSVTSTLAVTPTLAAVTAPTSLVATPDNVNGIINLTWTNPSPPAAPGNRVYYRRTGSSAWTLLYDSPTAIAAYAAMDQIALGVSYDFAVSQLNLGGGNAIESVLVT